MRTRLTIAARVLKAKINMADIVLIESLTLVAPEIVNWIRSNVDALMNLGISKYDDQLSASGRFGDLLHKRFEIGFEKYAEKQQKRAFLWTNELKNEDPLSFPIRNAMGYLFDKCTRWSSTPERSNYMRMQEFRFWNQWLCYQDQHESWSVSEIKNLLQNPTQLLKEKIHLNNDSFRDFFQQICDIGYKNISPINAKELVVMFRQAEEVLSPSIWLNQNFGYGPLYAVLMILRSDPDAQRRAEAIAEIIQTCSIKLSMPVLRKSYKNNLDPEQPLLEEHDSNWPSLTETFFSMACECFSKEKWLSQATEFCPYNLLNFMYHKGIHENDLMSFSTKFIATDPKKLQQFFACFSDQCLEAVERDINWKIIPTASKILELANQSSDFSSSHSKFIIRMNNKAQSTEQPSTNEQ